ncbi:MAG: phospholipase, partial [Desulfuromonadales bacterium]|nr:phospholipase [Desulfuromonadales bacterium]
MCDLAKALQNALTDKLGDNWNEPFHIITHSTGALVVRHWIARHYRNEHCAAQPLQNLIFLAGPHFGSRLAHHGRSMLAHIRYLGDTGTKILNALELGS